jgi:hypothetical protein
MTREFELMAENAELRHELEILRGDHLAAWGHLELYRVNFDGVSIPVDTYSDGAPLRLFINGRWIAVRDFGDEFREILTAKIAAMKEAA